MGKGRVENAIIVDESYEDVQLSESQERLEELSDKQKKIVEDVSDWLIKKRNYKDYDIDAEFKVDKIIPLLKYVENGEILFNEENIVQNLRFPIELRNAKDEVVREIKSLTYKIRYRAFELNNYTKGINLSKEMNLYMDAQVGMLTGIARSIIGKLFDTDHSTTRLIQSLYFL